MFHPISSIFNRYNSKIDRKNKTTSKIESIIQYYIDDSGVSHNLQETDRNEIEAYKQRIRLQVKKDQQRNILWYVLIVTGVSILLGTIIYI